MAVAKALEKKIKFYTSPDLKNWTWTSDFGPAGDSEKSWELSLIHIWIEENSGFGYSGNPFCEGLQPSPLSSVAGCQLDE